jgi:branched-chain amino acid transport system ATP-binding protein
VLEVRNLAKSFGSLAALDDVTFGVGARTITGLIGPNGAGKTTLFDTVAGMQRADRGEIRLRGERIDGKRPDRIFRRGLARTFQIPRPFGGMTVLENVMLAPGGQAGERFWNSWIRYRRVAREEHAIRRRALELLRFCELDGQSGALARTLSGGQQKLLELARVLMAAPSLILLDEPAAGVNPALMETLIEKIRELHRSGITFLVIEHNMDMVMSICHPIVVMARGRVIYQGDAAGARADPQVLDAYLGDVPG